MDVAGLLIPSFKAGAAASGVLVEQRELDLIGLPYDWLLIAGLLFVAAALLVSDLKLAVDFSLPWCGFSIGRHGSFPDLQVVLIQRHVQLLFLIEVEPQDGMQAVEEPTEIAQVGGLGAGFG